MHRTNQVEIPKDQIHKIRVFRLKELIFAAFAHATAGLIFVTMAMFCYPFFLTERQN
jgi:hypothetical protein